MYSTNKSFSTDSTWSTVGVEQPGLRMSVDQVETLWVGNERGIKHQTGRERDQTGESFLKCGVPGSPGANIINVFRAWIGAQLTICAQK